MDGKFNEISVGRIVTLPGVTDDVADTGPTVIVSPETPSTLCGVNWYV